MQLQDPLRTTSFSVRYIVGISKTLMKDKAFENAVMVKVPTLILQGDADTEALPNGAKRLLESLAAEDKTLKMFSSADHRLLDVGEKVCSAIEGWLLSH